MAAWAIMAGLVEAQPLELITRARQLYNEQQYDAAIAAAEKARALPATADTARLVLARARLERFRQSADPEDLALARDALREVRPDGLSLRERPEYLVGVGEALYLDHFFGPAAEVFETALDHGSALEGAVRERVLDWWATSIDRQVQLRGPDRREVVYAQMLDRLEAEVARDPQSAVAVYWLSAAARGAGELDRAWDTAIAGWVRAGLTRDRGATLRADLERLVVEAIIPERSRDLGTSDADRERIAGEMQAEWAAIKQRWSGR